MDDRRQVEVREKGLAVLSHARRFSVMDRKGFSSLQENRKKNKEHKSEVMKKYINGIVEPSRFDNHK